jgi:FtsP/CotA-like multicopper oxidase with cupredoxin domain
MHHSTPVLHPAEQPTDATAATGMAATPDVRVELEATPCDWPIGPGNRTLRGWGYNGTVPGPTIEARVGQLLAVRVTNSLDEPTTIHWHGLRVPFAMDGTGASQHPIPPGESFEYRFRLPDAGTFWYHPHSNETVQLERGLYGALIVRGDEEPVVDAERVLLLDDVKLTWRGRIAPTGGWLERHNGREGKVRLVNGRADARLEMAAGQVERWRIANVANASYVRLALDGREFRVIGTDGGLIEAAVPATEVLLGPGDRIDLVVGPFEEGDDFPVRALEFDRGLGRRPTATLATVRVGQSLPSRALIPERLREIPPLAAFDAPVNRRVVLSGRMSLRRGVDFLIDGEMHHHAPPVRIGELQVWDIANETPIDHPFHLHGFFFQVLSTNGAPPPYRSWEDTVNVPPHGTVRIAWVADDRPGTWMYHCHILEHHAAGMMAHFDVVP